MSDQKDINSANVEKCLAEINEVFRDSDESLDRFAKRLVEIALDTEQSISATANIAQEFSRQGLDMESILKRTRDALILSRLSGIDAANSVKSLSAAVSAFLQKGLSGKFGFIHVHQIPEGLKPGDINVIDNLTGKPIEFSKRYWATDDGAPVAVYSIEYVDDTTGLVGGIVSHYEKWSSKTGLGPLIYSGSFYETRDISIKINTSK